MNPSLLKKAELSGDRVTEYAEMVKNVTASD